MELLYNWEFKNKEEKWKNWYLIALTVIIWLVIWWFFTPWYYWFSFIVIFVSWVYYFFENNSEDYLYVAITNFWLQIWSRFYEYWKFKNYMYIYSWGIPMILRLKLIAPNINEKEIDLRIDEHILLDLQEILPNYLEQERDGELTLTEKISYGIKL